MNAKKIYPGCTVIVVAPGTVVKLDPAVGDILVVEDANCPAGHVLVASYAAVMDAYRAALDQMGYTPGGNAPPVRIVLTN